MTILKSKGTKLQHSISAVLTDIAQVIGIEGPDPEVETFNANHLGVTTAGIPKKPTGNTDGGTLTFDLFFDPALAGHQDLTDQLVTPASTNWALVFADTTDWPFAGVFKKLSPAVDLADGLKASCEIEVDGLVDYPT